MNARTVDAKQAHVLSIGHSTLEYSQFAERLKVAGVTAVADVRSSPFSRNFPQYNREELKKSLSADGIAYVFLGRELGGRPNDRKYYTDGIADYEKMAAAPEFSEGLDRVTEGARKYCIALMCSEKSPFDCHRCLLVGRALKSRGVSVEHILGSGEKLTHDDVEDRLLAMADKQNDDMFASPFDRLNDAYRARAIKVAFAEDSTIRADKFMAGGAGHGKNPSPDNWIHENKRRGVL
jgi:hypothetical protein